MKMMDSERSGKCAEQRVGGWESMKGVRVPLKSASGAGVDKTGVATANVADSIRCCLDENLNSNPFCLSPSGKA